MSTPLIQLTFHIDDLRIIVGHLDVSAYCIGLAVSGLAVQLWLAFDPLRKIQQLARRLTDITVKIEVSARLRVTASRHRT